MAKKVKRKAYEATTWALLFPGSGRLMAFTRKAEALSYSRLPYSEGAVVIRVRITEVR